MKISLEWLKEYVDLPSEAGELVDVLPMLGLEVEEAESSEAPSLNHVVVGEVLEKQPHPEADRLSVCQVNVGAEQPANIVCGAISKWVTGCRLPYPGPNYPVDSK
jgi:phenylalanyl-tRNA synthetase beta chain